MPRSTSALVCTLLATAALAQSNAVPGTDVNLYDVGGSTIYGRRGPAHPNGEIGIGFGHAFCNAGTVHVPWQSSPTTSGQMTDIHFKIAFMIARESNGRMVQVSKRESGVKHSRVTYNLGSSQCGTCISGPSGTFRMGCYDAYGTSFNGNRFNIGPAIEIDPWLGSWNPVGSYFDRGDPDVGPPNNNDGTQSLTSSQVASFDSVKNRVTVDEQELLAGGTFYGQVHLVCEGEPLAARGNNLLSEELSFTHNGGGNWSTFNAGGPAAGSVLNQWTGANVSLGGNGADDGRFAVGVKVTGPSGGQWRYEYVVHNIDNNRGGASFRIPLTAAVNVSNVGFRDIDGNALNEWQFSQTASELSWTAPAGNPIDWNTMYNFYFDCDTAPGQGGVLIDQARVGPGQLDVLVISEVPGGSPVATVTPVGTSCGDCDSAFYEFFSSPSTMDLSGTSATLSYAGGQYTVGSSTGSYQTPSGTILSLSDDDEASVGLPFVLPYPGGTTTQLRICSNGFVSPVSGNGTAYTPSVGGFLNGQARWAMGWHDLNPSAGGQVRVSTNLTSATVSYVNVRDFGSTNTSTFQIQFESNGTVHMFWQSMSTSGNSWLVGWGPGPGASAAGSIDLTSEIPAGFALCATAAQGITLSTSARPILGTTIQQITSDIAPSTAFGVLMMSHTQALPSINLSVYGMEGCFGHVANGANRFFFPNGASSVSIPLTIPNWSGFTGLPIVSQSFAYTPPLTTLGMISSNGIVMIVGPQ